jgi:uncharacterized protein (TIGR02996 family)
MRTFEDWCRVLAEEPASKDLRLICADWLDENSQGDRAEFIRTQLMLSPVKGMNPMRAAVEFGSPRDYYALREREAALLHAFSGVREGRKTLSNKAWWSLQAFGSMIPRRPWERVEFHDGFPDRVVVTTKEWLNHGKQTVRATPVIGLLLSDKMPSREERNGKVWYRWWSAGQGRSRMPDWIPGAFFKWISREGEARRWRWSSPQDAIYALSEAALRWAWKG